MSIDQDYNEVDRPSHYTEGRKFEVIDVLEDWVARSPCPIQGSLLFSCLKYLGRLYDKGDPEVNARKARWYLDRLIKRIEEDSNFIRVNLPDAN